MVLVGCAVVISVELFRVLRDVHEVTEKVAGLTNDVSALKDGVKLAVLTVIQNLLEKAKKGGAKTSGKQKE